VAIGVHSWFNNKSPRDFHGTQEAVLAAGARDVDTLIMALYCIRFNRDGCRVTPEPLGPGGEPYPAMNGMPEPKLLERLAGQAARCFREREATV